MGESGSGKDTFAATWPKPLLLWHLDGYGQDMPYQKGAQSVGEIQKMQMQNFQIPYRDIVAADGGFVRVEYYSSESAQYPYVSQVLELRMQTFAQEQAQWATLCCGSLSSAALENRLYEQFVLNPHYKDPRKWYGAATEYLERLIFGQKALTCNVVFMCHIGKDKDEVGGEYLFTPDLPGRLSYAAGRYFNEMYRTFVTRDANGNPSYVLQTGNDGRYQCKTHIDAPMLCWPTYESLWVNWK